MRHPHSNGSRTQAGFSLVEMMIAMVVTLVVSGAIYGLIASGSNAFRREPELSDRQQNIRVAMNLIQNDLRAAGGGSAPGIFKVFTDGLNGAGPAGPGGVNSDYLEFWATDGQCPDLMVESTDVTSGVNLNFALSIPSCVPEPSFILVFSATSVKWGLGHNAHGSGNKKLNFPGGQQPPGSQINGPGDLGNPAPTGAVSVQRMRYAIANDADGAPALWHSLSGGMDTSGIFQAAPSTAGGWVLVARGIEDLQVRYRTANAWVDSPPANVAVSDDVVRQVRITLSSRVLGNNIQGATASSVGSAVRGQLTSVTSPRVVLQTLADATPQQWR